MISLTDEQKNAVNFPSNIALSACPGSGKTRVIIAKLLKLAEGVEDTPLSIGCITYTNAAVDEIEARIKLVGTNRLVERCEISTIHSFCLNFILRPYGWMHPDVPKGFSILTQQMREFEEIVRAVEDEIGRSIQRSTFDDYGSLRHTSNGQPAGSGIEGGIVTAQTAARYWEFLRGRGFLDFSMILYYSLCVLQAQPFVAKGIASRFAWLLIDEFQDTTDVQIAIFAHLRRHLHTQFFMVGDAHQSINGFAGADTALGDRFCDHIGADRNHALSGNFRCAPQIITPAETLIPRTPVMSAKGSAAARNGIVYYQHVANPATGIEDYFLPALEALGVAHGSAAVLAPWWQHLVPVARHLRDLGVPVFGPGNDQADFTLDVLLEDSKRPVFVFFVIPPELTEQSAPLIRQFFSTLRTLKQRKPSAPTINLVIDEAAQLGRFPEIAEFYSIGRGFGLSPLTIYQDIGQIERNLGPTGATTISASADLEVYLGGGISDLKTAEHLSRKLGNPVEDHQALGRVLAALGRSSLSSNLNQLARAVNTGTLPVHPETEAELMSACHEIKAIRAELVRALGLGGGLRGLWGWITGKNRKIREENEAEMARAQQRNRDEKHSIIQKQLSERYLSPRLRKVSRALPAGHTLGTLPCSQPSLSSEY